MLDFFHTFMSMFPSKMASIRAQGMSIICTRMYPLLRSVQLSRPHLPPGQALLPDLQVQIWQ